MEETYALQTLREAITGIDAMTAGDAASERFTRWQAHAVEALIAARGEDSHDVTQFRHIIYHTGAASSDKAVVERLWQAGKELAKQILCDTLHEAERRESHAAQVQRQASASIH